MTILCVVLCRAVVFCSYNVTIPVTSGFTVLSIPAAAREVFQQRLNSFNDWSLVGMLMSHVQSHAAVCYAVTECTGWARKPGLAAIDNYASTCCDV